MLDTPRSTHVILLSALLSRSLPITSNKLRYFQTRGVNIQWNCSSAVSLWATLYTNGSTEGLPTETPWIFAWIIRWATASAGNLLLMDGNSLTDNPCPYVDVEQVTALRQTRLPLRVTNLLPVRVTHFKWSVDGPEFDSWSQRKACLFQERPDRLWCPLSTQWSE